MGSLEVVPDMVTTFLLTLSIYLSILLFIYLIYIHIYFKYIYICKSAFEEKRNVFMEVSPPHPQKDC